MKYFILISSFCLLSFTVFSQDKKAKAILDAMSSKYQKMATFAANFTYGNEGANSKITGAQTGSVIVKGIKFKIKTAGQEIFNNGKEMFTYVKENNEVNITNPNETDDQDFSPTKIYSIYKKGYTYVFKDEKKDGNDVIETVELTPTTSKSNISKIWISVSKTDRSIKSWRVLDKSGKKMLFRIDKFTPNAPATDASFVFDKKKYPSVEVVDLR
ncbi:MAG: LolA family protein [Leadbetterella sp.]